MQTASSPTTARLLIAAGIVGMIASLIGIIVVWMLLDDLGDGVDQSIELTTETLGTLDESLVLADNLTATVLTSSATLDTTIARLATSVDETSTVLDSFAQLSGEELPESIDGVVEGIDNLRGVADSIDATLRAVSAIGLTSYNPEENFSDTLGTIRDNLAPTATELREISPDLDALSTTVSDSTADLDQLSTDLATLRTDLDTIDPLIDDYRERVEEAQTLASNTSADLGRDRALAKTVSLILGLALAAGQLVPILYGKERLATAQV